MPFFSSTNKGDIVKITFPSLLAAILLLASAPLLAETTYIFPCIDADDIPQTTVEVTKETGDQSFFPAGTFEAEEKCSQLGLKAHSTKFILKSANDEGFEDINYLKLISQKYSRNYEYGYRLNESWKPYIYIDGRFYYLCTDSQKLFRERGLSDNSFRHNDNYCSQGGTGLLKFIYKKALKK